MEKMNDPDSYEKQNINIFINKDNKPGFQRNHNKNIKFLFR